MVLETAYFPPVEYFAILAKYSAVYLEACETYQKQSYRNRCYFYGASGKESLNVPVVHENGTFHLPVKEIKVDYSTDWVEKTERAIRSAYCSSPFFMYYEDELFRILDSRPLTLWELNRSLMDFFCRKIGIAPEFRETEVFTGPSVDIHPKHPSAFTAKEYYQVFSEKHGFIGNLSVMDLLFNEGPESICYLK
ncbi:MAG: WbqC family protein [Bacteroidales bacterium]|nr:WbqC family protein [Candidatus Cryptobacteroides caccocaballi]